MSRKHWNGGEMGTGSDTGAFFIGGMRQPG